MGKAMKTNRRPADKDGRSPGSEPFGITKFYIARLPERCSSTDVAEVLGHFGVVEGVYIARKRDKRGFRFGFASFKGVKDVMDLEKKMRNVWMGSYKLFINVARFSLENEEGGAKTKDEEMKKPHGFEVKENRHKLPNDLNSGRDKSFVSYGKSFASVVSGKPQSNSSLKEVVISKFAKAYTDLHGVAIVGKAKDLWTLRKMKVLMKEANYGESIIKYLGGLNILLVFKTTMEADSFRSNAPGFGWFESMEIWRGQSVAFERLAWLNIHGVPLHLSGNETFDSVGRVFGKVIHASQRQPEDNLLTSDCVCVMTDSVKRIEEEVLIIEEGKRFRVWVEEERGEWVPDSVEEQRDLEVEDEGWDPLSEEDTCSLKEDFNGPGGNSDDMVSLPKEGSISGSKDDNVGPERIFNYNSTKSGGSRSDKSDDSTPEDRMNTSENLADNTGGYPTVGEGNVGINVVGEKVVDVGINLVGANLEDINYDGASEDVNVQKETIGQKNVKEVAKFPSCFNWDFGDKVGTHRKG
ncbi:putative RNA recognition motif domain, nucleotide-binding alpha-beta plait domain superfamily [Helianthus annuus]|uniref:RNA recognition motif domain, nucleotide-binding alpha-beta plait domain superfamily n=1 Tax=Helianthus annuus TaxID=4232 RepID=A0A9K3JH41_HELAN|nr:putative RNA recognition motif domain, nucleotide-binding alpha-beta plait domain superfamily [Helianthus annuus]